ncbi:MAG: hypothetical protein DRI87_03265 [Bacteroidetes bacterium]|nr:MAG: hypothetical protein DRI87_03265 [Bacteroidota bacterium]
MKKLFILFTLISFLILNSTAQTLNPASVSKAVFHDVSKPLRDIDPVPIGSIKSAFENREVPNKFNFLEEEEEPLNGPDPALQSSQGGSRFEIQLNQNFNGVHNTYSVAPPDTDGDVSLNHYMQMVNLGFAIWDKEGNLLYGPAHNLTLWDGFEGPWTGTNDGDPIILYDEYADRWIASQFSLPNRPNGPHYELVAVSATGDPTGEWYRYAFEFEHMPDYPKFGIWNDGYYFTINQFDLTSNPAWRGAGVVALDREAMLVGDPDAAMVFFDLGASYGSLLPADADGQLQPPEGAPCYFVNMGSNVLRIWETQIDWEVTENSTIQLITSLPTQSFSSNNINVRQPGTDQKLATLAGRLMNRLQYRNFSDYEVMLTNHTVNAGSGRAGVRWYELRKYDNDWEIYQQGTYAPDDGNSRWMGSVAMNQYGDIAVGYSVSSSDTYPSIRFAGQSAANSGTGLLDIPETSIYEGVNSQTGVNRWGDYSMMSVDPSDQQSFWFTTEFTNGGWDWATQIASFSFSQIPAVDFIADEPLIPVGGTVNFTDLTIGLPTSWTWTFEGAETNASNQQNPENIVYSNEGFYTVQLIATNELGADTVAKEGYIEVSSTVLPLVDFMIDKNFLCTGESVVFTDLTELSPISWEWQFDPPSVTFINGTDQNSQNPEVIFNEVANYSVTLKAWNLNGPSSLTKENFITTGGYQPFFKETFEDDIANRYWTIENPDNDKTWEMFEVGGTSPGNTAAGVDFSRYYALEQRDRLISPIINLDGMSSAYLTFNHAYARKFEENVSDSLIIYVSDDCGENWTKIFTMGEDGTGIFATHELTDDFWPQTGSDWCMWGWGASCFNIDLSPWAGQHNIQIAFETYSFYGNPLFIDNIVISQFVGENELAGNDEIQIYPNPTHASLQLNFPNDHSYTKLSVMDQMGRTVLEQAVSPNSKSMELNNLDKLPKGIYMIYVTGNNDSHTQKIVIN